MIEIRPCVAARCPERIPAMWALCRHHFKLVPPPLRDAVSHAFNRYVANHEQGAAFARAVLEMDAWIRADAEVNEKPRANWDRIVERVRERDGERKARKAVT